MPSTSEKQRRFMGMDLARAEKGEKTSTGMTTSQLRDFARKPVKRSSNRKTYRNSSR